MNTNSIGEEKKKKTVLMLLLLRSNYIAASRKLASSCKAYKGKVKRPTGKFYGFS